MSSKSAKKTKYRGKAENLTNAGKGRPKGVKNKLTASVKEAIMKAFEEVGGADYLANVAKDDPRTFCTLLGKIIPSDINLSGSVTLAEIITASNEEDNDRDGSEKESGQ